MPKADQHRKRLQAKYSNTTVITDFLPMPSAYWIELYLAVYKCDALLKPRSTFWDNKSYSGTQSIENG